MGHPTCKGESQLLFVVFVLLVGVVVAVLTSPANEFGFHGISGFAVFVGVVARETEAVFVGVAHDEAIGIDDVRKQIADPLNFLHVTAIFFGGVTQFGHEALHHILSHHAAVVTCGGGAKKGCQFIELFLGPLGEGMVVALSAGDVGAKKDGKGIGEIVQSHTGVTQEVAGGAVAPELACGGEHGGDRFIVGPIFADLLLDPSNVGLRFHEAAIVRVANPEHSGEIVVEVAGVAVRIQQGANQLRAFLGGGVVEKRHRFRPTGDAPGDVQIGAANEGFV